MHRYSIMAILAALVFILTLVVLWPSGKTPATTNRSTRNEQGTQKVSSVPSDGEFDSAEEAIDENEYYPKDILSAIYELESQSDPKCHSTACRFEDFIYGTPLSSEARETKTDLQKELVSEIWRSASKLAGSQDSDVINAAHIKQVSSAFVRIDELDPKEIKVKFTTDELIELSYVRKRQIGSIAYSLRAVLAVHQDTLMNHASLGLPLSTSGVEAICDLVDTVTLAALKVADKLARQSSSASVKKQQLVSAWRQLVPQLANNRKATVATAFQPDKKQYAVARKQLLEMIDGKMAAYVNYNQDGKEEYSERLVKNIQKFYALYQYPLYQPWIKRLEDAFDNEMRQFTIELLQAASDRAKVQRNGLIRSSDATSAVMQKAPHLVDDFEDVIYFQAVQGEQVTLESYDCDSFRDTGLHWKYFRVGIESMGEEFVLPDPFASEVITEAISGYGVLLFRIAGRIAEGLNDAPALRPSHLASARKSIQSLATKHHQTQSGKKNKSINTNDVVSSIHEDVSDVNGGYFLDCTSNSCVDFEHDSSRWLHQFRRDSVVDTFPTFSGGGVAAGDVDDDGNIDLLLVGGTSKSLYFGVGNGTFVPAVELNKLLSGHVGEGRQPLIADFDNDGQQDLFISCVNSNHLLLKNMTNRRFVDVSSSAGLGGDGIISGAATTFDFDNDGLLDLYITGFGNYLDGIGPKTDRDNRNGIPNRLFQNIGGLKFVDVSVRSGTNDSGWCQAVSHVDLDRDGLQDIFVANDFGRNTIYRNLGMGNFENVGPALGHSKAYHSMNVGVSDLNRDGFPDVYVSNIATMVKDNKYTFPDATTTQKLDLTALSNMLVKESNVMYVSVAENGQLSRHRESIAIERGESTSGWAWDAEFFDYDNDGDDDLYVVNGSNDYNIYSAVVSTGLNTPDKTKHFQIRNSRESNVFFVNEKGRLKNRSSASGANFSGNSRSTAYLDWDHDGDLDIAVNNFQSPARLLENKTKNENHWVKVKLVGDPNKKTNRDAIGARILITDAKGLYVVREIQGGSGYLSQNPKLQHFGLGRATSFEVKIHWPNGAVQSFDDLAVDEIHVIHQE